MPGAKVFVSQDGKHLKVSSFGFSALKHVAKLRASALLCNSHCELSGHLSSCIMVNYSVYLVTGRTVRGTPRAYVGYTRALDVRKHFNRLQGEPCWMRPWLEDRKQIMRSSLVFFKSDCGFSFLHFPRARGLSICISIRKRSTRC